MSEAALELREVRGPSAMGGGWRRALELLYLIASTEFKRTYFNNALGYLWARLSEEDVYFRHRTKLQPGDVPTAAAP